MSRPAACADQGESKGLRGAIAAAHTGLLYMLGIKRMWLCCNLWWVNYNMGAPNYTLPLLINVTIRVKQSEVFFTT